jgi:hypothetical protein
MADEFASYQGGLTAPARAGAPITPSDTAELPETTRALYIGGTGSVRLRLASGDVVDFPALMGGVVYPFRVTQVMLSGTSATGLIGLR